jgi:peptide/nickel transport system substrate-binding protein
MLALIALPTAPAGAQATGARSVALGAAPSLVVDEGPEPTTLDPQINYDTAAPIWLGNVYERLVKAVGVSRVSIAPDLATSWTNSADGKAWTFHLRPGVTFHDSTPLNAAAVQFTFQRLFGLDQGAVADFQPIARVDAPSPLTVVFHLKTPFPSFLASLVSIWGTGIVSPTAVKKHATKGDPWASKWLYEHDAGSGPYMVKQWAHNQHLLLTPYPGYWRGWSGAHIGEVVQQWPASSSTQRLGLEHGDVDMAMGLSWQDQAAVAKEPGLTVQTNTGSGIREIYLNCTDGPLRSKLVRQALSYLFDYDGVIKAVAHGWAVRMNSIAPTGLTNYIPASHPYSYDPTKAAALLAKAGYGHGFNLTVTYVQGDAPAQQIAQIYQADAGAVGIKVTIRAITGSQYFNLENKAGTAPDFLLNYWLNDYGDDQQIYWTQFYSGIRPPANSNWMWYTNPAVDQLLVKAQNAPTAAAQHADYAQAVPLIYDDAPGIWAYQGIDRVGMRAAIHGYTYNYMYSGGYVDFYALSKS